MMKNKNTSLDLVIRNVDYLGLIAGMCNEIDIAGIIDRECGAQAHNKSISFGKAVVCMILNGLGFIGRTLYPQSILKTNHLVIF